MPTRLGTLTPGTTPLDPNAYNTDVVKPPRPPVVKPKLPEPKPNITLPPKLNRPPTTADLIIKRTFDGKTPEAAAASVRRGFRGKIDPANEQLVSATITQRVRDMQVALNNVFTKGTPNRQFLESQQPADIKVLGSMAQSSAVVYQVTQPGSEPKYYTKGWSGQMTLMAKPPSLVIMSADITLEPRGLKMTYPQWKHQALASAQRTTITEL
jgi:hypothetical protein